MALPLQLELPERHAELVQVFARRRAAEALAQHAQVRALKLPLSGFDLDRQVGPAHRDVQRLVGSCMDLVRGEESVGKVGRQSDHPRYVA